MGQAAAHRPGLAIYARLDRDGVDLDDETLPAGELYMDAMVADVNERAHAMLSSAGGDGTGLVVSSGTRSHTRDRTASEALDDTWPDDDWTGTAKEVHDLIGGEDGPYSLDTVKKALQRGRYASTETAGKPSVWRRS